MMRGNGNVDDSLHHKTLVALSKCRLKGRKTRAHVLTFRLGSDSRNMGCYR